jgi:hypothetical protein
MQAKVAVLLLVAGCSPGTITSTHGALGGDAGPGGKDAAAADARPMGSCAQTCAGCCIGDICFEGQVPQACGKGGATCQTCQTGQACADGKCGAGTDPCNGATAAGRCATSTRVEVCVPPTGNGSPSLTTYDCAAGEICQVVDGAAKCVLTAACSEGATECQSGTQLGTCVGGQWQTTTCAGSCVTDALGGHCESSTGGGTKTITGHVVYQARQPNQAISDWGTPYDAPAQGFLIAAVHQSGGTTTYLDTAVTTSTEASQGDFTLRVPSAPTASDFIIVYAAGSRSDGSLSFLVADPRLTASSTPYDEDASKPSPAVWSWSWRADSVGDSPLLRITEDQGSGAARVFDYLRYVYALGAERWPGAAADPPIIWLGFGVSWACGACNWSVPTTRFGTTFTSQLFMPGGSDHGYWADAVTAHELGHWIMFTFGRSVGEGGRHCFGVVSAPGLAWSEGWATWFSSDARDDPVYIDKQNGSMFWLDMSDRTTSGSGWPRPTASAGLTQDMYENEVVAMMWQLSRTMGLGRAPFDAALASTRMTVAPFERGYTRETWDTDSHCARTNVADTGESTTFFADFLDALRCGGVSASMIDAATNPTVRYPYPSSTPSCRNPQAPVTLAVGAASGSPLAGGHVDLRAELRRQGPWPYPIAVEWRLPQGLRATSGAQATVAEDGADLGLDLAIVPADDVVVAADSRGPAGGFHAEARYRFGRPEPPPNPGPERLGPETSVNGHELGASVAIGQ